MRRLTILVSCLAALLQAAPPATAQPLDLRLPTENHHLFTGELEKFYMYVDRNFEGVTSQPWEGGAYGYVRTPARVRGQVVMTRFHEGIDISPLKRDRAGNPLDLITSIADGRVVHVSGVAGRSNYGKYLVVEHQWEGSSIYSLYAHLADITVEPGDRVPAGGVLGRMGYTGVGLNRTRSHLHLELALLLSTRYDDWHRHFIGSLNHHGVHNGMNLAGADVAGFFLAHRENPNLTFSAFLATQEVYFKVTVPSTSMPDFVRRHPWMIEGESVPDAPSWELSFTATGLPVAARASERKVNAPLITAVRPSEVPHRHLTRGLVEGQGNEASLSQNGRRLVALVTDSFPNANR